MWPESIEGILLDDLCINDFKSSSCINAVGSHHALCRLFEIREIIGLET